ncbi:hypothetical protein ACEQ8H_006649 [Pleosporales sp. CAS-2024a]
MADLDDEWEYEYDEVETDDFYIPLDLSNVPSAQVPFNAERRPGHPTLLKSRLRALNAVRGQLPEMATDTAVSQDGTQETASMGEIQITGLHTSNPLIMYNGQLLSCQWTSTVGTDMFFIKPDPGDGDQRAPLRSLPSVDLLSLGTAKLVARVGRLRPRDELFEGDDETLLPSEATATGDAPSSTASQGTQQSPAVSLPSSKAFLARLNEAKARRGESSRLIVTQTPDGSRLISEHIPTARPGQNVHLQSADDVVMGGT